MQIAGIRMKRVVEVLIAAVLLLALSPLILITLLLVWWSDGHSPLYLPERIGRDGVPFRMVKIRSMVVDADKSGVDSTANSDPRITTIGHLIRRWKIDELLQLWNILAGDMSFVGPRPNIEREVRLYTDEERVLLSVRPGITDISSVVFADEGKILFGSPDANLAYNQLIRPWKSRLGLLHLQKRSVRLDFFVLLLTLLSIFSHKLAWRGVAMLLVSLGADEKLIAVASRNQPLYPYPPPGATEIVQSREK